MPFFQNSLSVEAFAIALISPFSFPPTLSHPLHLLVMVIDASSLNSFLFLYLLSLLFFALIDNGDQH